MAQFATPNNFQFQVLRSLFDQFLTTPSPDISSAQLHLHSAIKMPTYIQHLRQSINQTKNNNYMSIFDSSTSVDVIGLLNTVKITGTGRSLELTGRN
ncbi:6359_t:CDS:2 [Cetraspora pellucida]|uniref:6359_t:CDS:1 n=1 Tax=Cetraspora pellucida TaxID=1433469 RepID=A0A9N9HDI5_9GLOM|nr:6359_t:CDS:2 [Cetraspora pellucida]